MPPDFRWNAKQALDEAKRLVAVGDEPSLRNACLQLRLAIEYTTYGQLSGYLAEVPNDAVKRWTPREVIAALLEVDPNAEQSGTVTIARESSPGVPAETARFLGDDRRFTLSWAYKNHNLLGSFLHAPTLYQIEQGRVPTAADIRAKIEPIVWVLDHILSTNLFHVNFGYFLDFQCSFCKTPVRRRLGSFTAEQGIGCTNRACAATYDVEEVGQHRYEFRARKVRYTCSPCKTENVIFAHDVKVGNVFTCTECGSRAEFKLGLIPEQPVETRSE